MAAEIDRIVRMLEKTFDKGPWYGPSIMESLEGVTEATATRRSGKAHTIAELVMHMTSWRTFATRRLQGDNDYQVSDELNFPTPIGWPQALAKLKETQYALVEAARKFPEGRLGELVPSITQKYTYYTLLHGIAQHDIYHLGQINVLRKTQLA